MTIDLIKKLQEFKENEQHIPKSPNERVLIIDAMNMYIRCFAATPTMNDDGDHIGGVSGFLKSVGMIVRNHNPTRVICIFDGKGGSQRRRKLYENYKSKRKTMERLNRTYDFSTKEEEVESMKWQMHLLINLLENLPVTVISVDNIEADDSIAYLASVISERGGSSIIVSTDRDFLQLVNDTCTVYNPIKKKMYTVESVLDEYNIHPNNFILYRILIGDSSDNIPGVKGVGPKLVVKNFPFISEATEYEFMDIVNNCYDSNHKVHNKSCEKIINAYNDGILDRNFKLMQLKEVNISASSKLKVLNTFELPINELNKFSLTKALSEFKMLAAFGNYDQWITSTWTPLTRFKQENK